MITEKERYGQTLVRGVENEQTCPDCGGALREVERIHENDVSFIWYKCRRLDCNGAWLEKRVAAIRDW